jgi:hypothetical protein
LTCDFWAENAENKTRAKAKAIKSVASPFGLRSCLRQSGKAASRLPGRGAESPRSISKATANGLMKVYWMVRVIVAVWIMEPPAAVTLTA